MTFLKRFFMLAVVAASLHSHADGANLRGVNFVARDESQARQYSLPVSITISDLALYREHYLAEVQVVGVLELDGKAQKFQIPVRGFKASTSERLNFATELLRKELESNHGERIASLSLSFTSDRFGQELSELKVAGLYSFNSDPYHLEPEETSVVYRRED
jgi:hypothetical protein